MNNPKIDFALPPKIYARFLPQFCFFQKKQDKLFANTKIVINFVFQSAFRFKFYNLQSTIYNLQSKI
jgi:hypothetical protein